MTDSTPFVERLPQYRERIHAMLERALPPASAPPQRLHEAMRYSVLNGGKRIRAVLVLATGEAFRADPERLEPPACAVELVHAYSLVHDDLPSMDDDELRRGVPTCHRAFDEATAVLAGDALQALAFEVLADAPGPDAGELVRVLAHASGSRGMAGGQAIDLESTRRTPTPAQLEDMHLRKTGALIRASVRLGALSARTRDPEVLDRLEVFGRCIGLAFQIRDDVLDVEGATEKLGKRRGADAELGKPTYPAILGLDRSKRRARELHECALQSLAPFGRDADTLRGISGFIVERMS